MLFFESWFELFRVAVTAVIAYVLCIALVSLFGKRSAAKMNIFDWMVTVAMGSILGSAVLLKDVVILEVALALFMLLLLQYLFTLWSVKSTTFKHFMNKSPTLLFYDGKFIRRNLVKERVTDDEVRTCIRAHGFTSEEAVLAVVLEPSGEVSVLPAHTSPYHPPSLEDRVLKSVNRH